jgi:O-antigen/teichoic acid export membrane protein
VDRVSDKRAQVEPMRHASPTGDDAPTASEPDVVSRQIRGSSLLVVGRLCAVAVNFGVQITVVRYLTKADYGAFAYALTIAIVCQSIAVAGLDKAITRFVSIYYEQRDYRRVFGTIAVVAATVGSISVVIVGGVYALQDVLGGSALSDPTALSVLLILIFLGPLQAIDSVVLGLFAVFGRPRLIFFRAYILGPALRLIVVAALVATHSNVFFLALGYVLAGAAGVAISFFVLYEVFREEGLLEHFAIRTIDLPVRQIFSFTVPLLTTHLLYIILNSSNIVLLGHFDSAQDVAAFTVIQPGAALNELVLSSFTLLFTTAASRLFARDERTGIGDLYWRTAGWVAVMSFPIFALTFSFAKPLTVTLYGERYSGSAPYLAILSFGYYFQAALGMNGTTIMVFGKVRFITVINVLAIVVNLAANLILIPLYGPLGAALGTAGTLFAHNIFKQVGMRRATGIAAFRRHYARVYASVAVGAAMLLALQLALDANMIEALLLASVASFGVFGLNRGLLRMGETFPELRRFPLARRILL